MSNTSQLLNQVSVYEEHTFLPSLFTCLNLSFKRGEILPNNV